MVCIWYLDGLLTKSTFELDGSALPREEDSEESERFEESSCACWRVVEEPQEEEEEEEEEQEGLGEDKQSRPVQEKLLCLSAKSH